MSVYKPEFVEVVIAPSIEGACAWCGATTRYPADETSVECGKCGAQSARAIPRPGSPPRRQGRQGKIDDKRRLTNNPISKPFDLGRVALPFIFVAITASFGALIVYPLVMALR